MNQITVYTTSTCPFCDQMKNFLNEKELPFQEVNVQQDPGAAERLVKTGSSANRNKWTMGIGV